VTDPNQFEVVDTVPPIKRTGRTGTRTSKWDKVAAYLKEHPGVSVRYQDVSSSLGGDLRNRFYLKAENREVRDGGRRATLYLTYIPEYAAQVQKEQDAKAKAEA
jgi:hypothetical protein